MAPVVRALKAAEDFECLVLSSGQHREMLRQVLDIFDISVDHDLEVMTAGQTLNGAFQAIVGGMDRLLEQTRPDVLLVHGDTTTAAAASVAAFHRRVPVAHVEAGLRSGRMDQPWPEEFNRRLVDMVATQLYAPTEGSRANLLAEGVPDARILVTGNTVIDALLETSARIEADAALRADLDARFAHLDGTLPLVLVTGHRRESFGDGFRSICEALKALDATGEVQILYPVHMNPNVSGPVHELLTGCERVSLTEPVDYLTFVYLMKRCAVILTDSGGVQEEAPSLGKPVLVMREVTERPEAVAAGTAELVGVDSARIVCKVLEKLRAAPGTGGGNPYGDGQAARRIVEGLRLAFNDLR